MYLTQNLFKENLVHFMEMMFIFIMNNLRNMSDILLVVCCLLCWYFTHLERSLLPMKGLKSILDAYVI